MIDTKYGCLKGGWCSKEVTRPYRVGVWKFIRRGKRIQNLFDMRWVMGQRLVFGMMCVWCGNRPLKPLNGSLLSGVGGNMVVIKDKASIEITKKGCTRRLC